MTTVLRDPAEWNWRGPAEKMRGPMPVRRTARRASVAAPKPCRGCGDKRAAELVRAARASGATTDDVLRLLKEQREQGD